MMSKMTAKQRRIKYPNVSASLPRGREGSDALFLCLYFVIQINTNRRASSTLCSSRTRRRTAHVLRRGVCSLLLRKERERERLLQTKRSK